MIRRQFLLHLRMESLRLFTEDKRQQQIPRNEGQICVGVLVADQVIGTLVFEMLVQHGKHTLYFLAVAVDGRGDLVRMVDVKPHTLAEIRTLTGDLEV